MKETLLEIVAKGIRKIAEVSAESTSIIILYQPKTPKMLKKEIQKK